MILHRKHAAGMHYAFYSIIYTREGKLFLQLYVLTAFLALPAFVIQISLMLANNNKAGIY